MTKWIRSARCVSGTCVELGDDRTCDEVRMRDSKDPDGPQLVFTRAAMGAFLAEVRDGEFDTL